MKALVLRQQATTAVLMISKHLLGCSLQYPLLYRGPHIILGLGAVHFNSDVCVEVLDSTDVVVEAFQPHLWRERSTKK
jgi:hypothetical protein